MAQLTKGMYEVRGGNDTFGLRSGQMRHGDSKMTHNSGWYNKLGERLGWGDLSIRDFEQISRELKGDELFIILNELDSQASSVPPSSKAIDKDAPGIDYVAKHATFIIAQNQMYKVNHSNEGRETITWCSVQFKTLKHDEVIVMMLTAIAISS